MRILRLILVLAVISGALALAQNTETKPQSRHFMFTYAFTVKNTDPGKRLQVWFPLAHSDAWQQVNVVSATGDLPLRRTKAAENANEMLYAETAKADQAEYKFVVQYDVVRTERLAMEDGKPIVHQKVAKAEDARFLLPDRMVPISGRPAELAQQQVAGKSTELEKARAIYDYVFATLRYDKTGTGWGRGDVLWVCDAKHGNCTDFHSLFASMARSQGIPTRFAIGFPLPADKHAADIAGYHCWADFDLKGAGWIPIDISEAWKHPEKKDYFFGAHDQNRVQFSVGRDLTLNPKQAGAPLNYFVYPYVEYDGKEYSNVDNHFSFADVSEQQRAALQ
jgi:transglutaminase-like putative cysteine protease